MRDRLLAGYHGLYRRVIRFERREIRDFRRWIENTGNLLHLSALLFVPLLVAVVTLLSNSLRELSFLLFPPLASGAYTLFSDPEGPYSSPWKFVTGLTVGALCGWVALGVTSLVYHVPPDVVEVHASSAALGIFLTGAVTWAFDIEEPAAYSTALLVLVTGTTQFEYVASVGVSSALVAGVFVVWRRQFYHRRARYLYQSTRGDDHVLVPMRGDHAETTAFFAARLAAAHEAGKVVLLDVVDEETVEAAVEETERKLSAEAEARTGLAGVEGTVVTDSVVEKAAEAEVGEKAGERLERLASRIETVVGVPVEVVVAANGTMPVRTTLETARETGCDLIVTPYETEYGSLSGYVRGLFRGDVDVLAFRSTSERARWKRIMVPVRKTGDVAHSMIDFAERLGGRTGRISVCHCIARERERRPAESMLANLVETFSGPLETRIARAPIDDFLGTNGPYYDLIVLGASTDRSTASRFISPPTFERIQGIETDVAVFHRA